MPLFLLHDSTISLLPNRIFQASSHLLLLHRLSPVCVEPGPKPQRRVFSRQGSYDCVGNQFEAPSGGGQPWGQQFGGEQFPGQQILNDPMANMAMQYGTSLAGQGKDIVHKNVR